MTKKKPLYANLRVLNRQCGDIPGCLALPAGNQPEAYKGPIPSFEVLSFVKNLEQEHKEWQQRRAYLKDWRYNETTGMAEPRLKIKPKPGKAVAV